jgi:indole-3-glycerol phosphate synthase
MNILDSILEHKRSEIAAAKARISLSQLRARPFAGTRPPFRKLFDTGSVVIAEIKPKSPSAGELIHQSPLAVADLYARSAADAVSVLTDAKYFGGSLTLLSEVREHLPQPLLRKEFIVDEYQIYETAATPASAFLLIAAALTAHELRRFTELGRSLGLDALVEVHNEPELQKALDAGADLIGINNRNLQTLEIDLAVTEQLLPRIPSHIPVVSESGLQSSADVARVRSAGARGILVGTSVLRSSDPTGMINSFKAAL